VRQELTSIGVIRWLGKPHLEQGQAGAWVARPKAPGSPHKGCGNALRRLMIRPDRIRLTAPLRFRLEEVIA